MMINSFQCPKCNNNKIAGPHRIHADRRHSKIDLPGLSTATLEAYTCVGCGFTEFYVDDLGRENMIKSGRFLSSKYERDSFSTKQYCSVCNSEIHKNNEYCDSCGTQIG
ncbi:MAG: hypothetical protein ACW98I_19455 [Candidatus Hodarchaeales archaeon]|jgi:predicted nucleic-acid-binding Zn-ribbon protein